MACDASSVVPESQHLLSIAITSPLQLDVLVNPTSVWIFLSLEGLDHNQATLSVSVCLSLKVTINSFAIHDGPATEIPVKTTL